MKRIIAIAFLASVMGVATSSAAAQGTSNAAIPFAFRVGNTLMQPGTYHVQSRDERWFYLCSESGRDCALVLAATTSGSTAPAKKLVFNRYGERYFLSAVLGERGASEKTFARSKLERRIQSEEASDSNRERVLLALK
jgi:hypothetical protein